MRRQTRGDSVSPEPAFDALAEDVLRAQAGDSVALRRLLDAVGPEVVRVARAVSGPHTAELDDVVQEALINFVKALGSRWA